MEPIADAPEDEYEPPPHVFAQLGRGLLKLYCLVFPRPFAPTRRRYVWQSLFFALAYASLSGPLFRHFPARFHSAGYWHFMREVRLAEAWYSHEPKFWRLLAIAAYQSVIRAPLREEVLYRGLPILLARFAERRLPSKPGRIVILLITALASLDFASIHNPMPWTMPLPQLAFGIGAWWVAWNRGIRYSILMHFAVNLIFLVAMVERIWWSAHHL